MVDFSSEINSAYQKLFGRDADAGGMEFWSGKAAGGMTGDSLVNEILKGAGADDRKTVVNNAYGNLFDRAADAGGSAYWTDQNNWNRLLDHSGNLDSVLLGIGSAAANDDEFTLMDRLKSNSNQDWAKAFYDPTNADYVWRGLLDKDGYSLNMPKSTASTGGGTKGTTSNGYRDYFNSYLDDVLTSGIRKINEQGDMARNRLGTSAFSAGAYGDARHGIEGDNLTQSLMESIGDLTAQTKAQGFESAMGWMNRDLDRQANIALQNAALQNQWFGNQLDAANTGNNMGLNNYTQGTNWLSFLQGLDSSDRNWTQQGNNAAYQDFWAQQNWDQNQLTALLNVLNAIPGQTTNTSIASSPENSSTASLAAALQSAFSGGGSTSTTSKAPWTQLNLI